MEENNEKSLLERIVRKGIVVALIGGAIYGSCLIEKKVQSMEKEKLFQERMKQEDKKNILSEKESLEGYVSFVDTVYREQPRFSYVTIEGELFLYPHDDPLIPGHHVRIEYIPVTARYRMYGRDEVFDEMFNMEVVKFQNIHSETDPINKVMEECKGVITKIEYIESAPTK